MHSVEPGTTVRGTGAQLWRRAYRAVLLIVLVSGLIFAGGFYWFVSQMPVVEASPSHKADGIVVLTGGAFRISDALELLSTGHGRRLLDPDHAMAEACDPRRPTAIAAASVDHVARDGR